MKKTTLYAFALGLIEFRQSVTTHFAREHQRAAYEHGRELAHKLTLRAFEE